jgi:hypothetical protein
MDISTKTKRVLKIMNVLAWIAFIGLMVDAGGVLVSFGFSCFKPEAPKNFYNTYNLYKLSQYSFPNFTFSIFLMSIISASKAFMCYLVIKILSQVKMADPFTLEVVATVEQVSYVLFTIGLFAIVSDAHTDWVLRTTGDVLKKQDAGSFIFVSGLIFIIAQIFKRGVEIQTENDLTV